MCPAAVLACIVHGFLHLWLFSFGRADFLLRRRSLYYPVLEELSRDADGIGRMSNTM
jgi:hypothetical protein